MFQSAVSPICRLTPQPKEKGGADGLFLKRALTEKTFIGFAMLSSSLCP